MGHSLSTTTISSSPRLVAFHQFVNLSIYFQARESTLISTPSQVVYAFVYLDLIVVRGEGPCANCTQNDKQGSHV